MARDLSGYRQTRDLSGYKQSRDLSGYIQEEEPTAPVVEDDGRRDVTFGNAFSALGKFVGPGEFTEDYQFKQAELTPDELASTRGITAPVAATLALAPYTLPASIGTASAMGVGWLTDRAIDTSMRVASGDDFGDAITESVTSPWGLLGAAGGGLTGLKALGGTVLDQVPQIATKNYSGKQVLTDLINAGLAKQPTPVKGYGVGAMAERAANRGWLDSNSKWGNAGAYREGAIAGNAEEAGIARELEIQRLRDELTASGEIGSTPLPASSQSYVPELMDTARRTQDELSAAIDEVPHVRYQQTLRANEDKIAEIEAAKRALPNLERPKKKGGKLTKAQAAKNGKIKAARARYDAELKVQKGYRDSVADAGSPGPSVVPYAAKSATGKWATFKEWFTKKQGSEAQHSAEIRETFADVFRPHAKEGSSGLRSGVGSMKMLGKDPDKAGWFMRQIQKRYPGASVNPAIREVAQLGERSFHNREAIFRAVQGSARRDFQEARKALPDVLNAEQEELLYQALRSADPAEVIAASDQPWAQSFLGPVTQIRDMQERLLMTARAAGVKQDVGVSDLIGRIAAEADAAAKGKRPPLTQQQIDDWFETQGLDKGPQWTPENLESLAELMKQNGGKAAIKEAGEMGFEVTDTGSFVMDILRRQDYGFRAMRKPTGDTVMGALQKQHPEKSVEEIESMLSNMGQRRRKAFARDNQLDDDDEMLKELETYILSDLADQSTVIANSAAWNGTLDGMILSEQGGRLQKAGQVGVRLAGALDEGSAAQGAVRDAINRQYQKEVAPSAKIPRAGAAIASRMVLGKVAITSLTELGKAAWTIGGPRAAVRGLAYVNAHPQLKPIFETGGAQTAPIVDLLRSAIDEANPGELLKKSGGRFGSGIPMNMMASVERWLRGPGSYGSIDYMVTTAERAGKEMAGDFSGVTLQKAKEIFPNLSPQQAAMRLATEWNASGAAGTLPLATFEEGVGHLARRQYYSTSAGMIGESMKSPVGAAVMQYKQYPIQAAKHIKSDIIDVIGEGVRTGDSELQKLGYSRLVNLAMFTCTAATAGRLVKDVMSAKMFADEKYTDRVTSRIFDDCISTATGGFGQTIASAARGNIKDVIIPPALDVPASAASGLASGDLAEFVRAGGMLAGGLLDARIPLATDASANIIKNFTNEKDEPKTSGFGKAAGFGKK